MARVTKSRYAPMGAVALALAAGGLAWLFAQSQTIAVLLTIATFAAAMSCAIWAANEARQAQQDQDRALLAEELLALHEGVEALAPEATELREIVMDLATIVEDNFIAAGDAEFSEAAETALSRSSRIEGAAPPAVDEEALAEAAASAAARQVMEQISQRFHSYDERSRKLAKALSLTAAHALRSDNRLTEIENHLGAPHESPAQLEAPEVADAEPVIERRELPSQLPPAPAFVKPDMSSAQPNQSALLNAKALRERFERAPARGNNEAKEHPVEPTEAAKAVLAAKVSKLKAPRQAQERAGSPEELAVAPICRVATQSPRHFEALPMRDASEFDEKIFAKCAKALRALRSEDQNVQMFCDLPQSALAQRPVVEALVGFLMENPDLADGVTFEFSQAAFDRMGGAEISALRRLRGAGAGFSIEKVRDWSIDPGRLSKLGFRYIKLDCAGFLSRINGSNAERFLEKLNELGLDLIVDGVDDEALLQDVAAAGVRIAQGEALGAQRQVQLH